MQKHKRLLVLLFFAGLFVGITSCSSRRGGGKPCDCPSWSQIETPNHEKG